MTKWRMPHGQYAGLTARQIPSHYLRWYVRTAVEHPDSDEIAKRFIGELKRRQNRPRRPRKRRLKRKRQPDPITAEYLQIMGAQE